MTWFAQDGLNLLTHAIKGHQYVVLFSDDQRSQVPNFLGRWAANPGLNFTWADAAILANRLNHSQPLPAADPDCPF